LETPVGEVEGPEIDDISRPEVGQLRERLFVEHGRRLPYLADNSSHGPRSWPTSHGDSPLAGVAAKGQTDQGGTAFSDLAIFGLAVTAIMAVGHIGGAAAHRRSVASQTHFIDVFWGVVSDRPGCFQAWRQ